MHTMKKVIGVVTFAALSLSGPAVWAQSFKAKADLDTFHLVPSILGSRRGNVTITIHKPPPITEGTIALAPPLNPWTIKTRAPGNLELLIVENIRLYFGQRFVNGQPIATLCDASIDTADTDTICNDGGNLALSDIRFQSTQTVVDVTVPDEGVLDEEGRLDNDESGFRLLKGLINRGLIYVVINSPYKAKVVKTDTGPIVEYTPPPRRCFFLASFICTTPKGEIISDGDIRGTLRLVE